MFWRRWAEADASESDPNVVASSEPLRDTIDVMQEASSTPSSQPSNLTYRADTIAVCVGAGIVMPIETWRRWGDWFSTGYFDDFSYFVVAFVALWLIRSGHRMGPRLWTYSLGYGGFMALFSFLGGIERYELGDVSGIGMPAVLTFKGVGVVLLSFLAYRDLRRSPTPPANR